MQRSLAYPPLDERMPVADRQNTGGQNASGNASVLLLLSHTPNASPSIALFTLTTTAYSMPVDKSDIAARQFDLRSTRGIPLVYLWFTTGRPLAYPRYTLGIPEVYPRFTPGKPQVYPRYTPGLPQVNPSSP